MRGIALLALAGAVLAAPQPQRRQAAASSATVADDAPVSAQATTVTSITATSTVVTTTRSLSEQTLVPTTPAAVKPMVAQQQVVAGVPTISGTGTLPKPTSFVKNNGDSRLFLDGKVYRIVGPNIFWLALDQDPTRIPEQARVREAMAIAVGNSLSFEPSPGVFNQAAFKAISYAVFAAKQYGLRVIIPLTDQYQYYLGGKCDFVRWAGASTSNYCNAFYSNSNVLALFRTYIKQLLTTVNPYTGLTLAQEPAVLAFETGNEFGAYMLQQGAPPQSFTQGIATYIKSLAPNALVIDGTDGVRLPNGQGIPGLGASAVDIVSNHQYPPSPSLLNSDFSLSSNARKVLLVGEYDWTNSATPSFLSAVEGKRGVGDMLWSVYGHTADCSAFVQHNDGYSLYYPNGNPQSQQANIYRQTGRTPPSALPGVVCPQPVF